MFQISPRWNRISLDHLSNRKCLPSIDYFYYNSSWLPGIVFLDMRIADKSLLNFFGMQDWKWNTRVLFAFFLLKMIQKIQTKCYQFIFKKHESKKALYPRVSRILGRCWRIQELTLMMNTTENDFDQMNMFKNAISNVTIAELYIINEAWEQDFKSV